MAWNHVPLKGGAGESPHRVRSCPASGSWGDVSWTTSSRGGATLLLLATAPLAPATPGHNKIQRIRRSRILRRPTILPKLTSQRLSAKPAGYLPKMKSRALFELPSLSSSLFSIAKSSGYRCIARTLSLTRISVLHRYLLGPEVHCLLSLSRRRAIRFPCQLL